MIYFPQVASAIEFEGPDSRNPLSFRHYDAGGLVGDKTMAEHLRFAVCFWHTFKGTGMDPFGAPTMMREWDKAADPRQRAEDTLDAAFEFMSKLGVEFWCFHDRDIAPEGNDFTETCANLERMTERAKAKQEEHDIELLWGTANLFSHPRYQAGAATSPDPHVFANAAAQVKHAMEATQRLGGQGYVFWGGREGYDTLLNVDMKLERENFARLLWMTVEHAKKIGFHGQLYIEPKPMEPTKHQYDADAEACLNFLREFGLMEHLKLNIETNHATLAGHTIQHELQVARHAGALGSIDANAGDILLGWDTDQFPTDIYLTTTIMMEVLEMGGFTTGGLNFDAKVRRQSHEPIDLFYAHVGGMDAFARGLEIAYRIQQDGRLSQLLEARYAEWGSELGKGIRGGSTTLDECDVFIRKNGEPARHSGRQEMLENLINEYVL